MPPPTKIARQKRTKSRITQPSIVRFRSNSVHSLNARHLKCCNSLRLKGQRSRSLAPVAVRSFRRGGASCLLAAPLEMCTHNAGRPFQLPDQYTRSR